MSKLKSSTGFAATALILIFASAPANAQATRTWVSGVGDDANPCSRTAPCKTFAGAISKTARDGEISVLDPGGFGNVTITKSITLNGTQGAGYGSILVPAASTGVIINIIDPADVRRTVRLINLDINGAGSAANGVRILGIAGSSVVIENTNIDGMTARGISDERASGGKLVVSNTAIRHNVGSAIHIVGGATINATISNVRLHNNGGAGVSGNGGSKVMVSDSVSSGSTTGLDVQGAGSEMTVDGATISQNGTGMNVGAGAILRLSNSNVSFNATSVVGNVSSFTNNRFVGNVGGSITPIGGASSPSGQQ